MAATVKQAVSKAASQIGVKESPPNSNIVKYWDFYKQRTGKNFQGSPWCLAFITWVLAQVKQWSFKKDAGMYRYCPSLVTYAKNKKRWYDRSAKPKAGDIILFANKSGTACHVGIVEKVLSNGNLQTIEGNTSLTSNDNGGSVMRRIRSYGNVGSSFYVLGFYRPNYKTTTTSSSSTTTNTTTPKPASNVKYKITTSSGVNIRKQPKKSASIVSGSKKAYAKGETVTVTETVVENGNTWGKTSLGYFAIKYNGSTYAIKI